MAHSVPGSGHNHPPIGWIEVLRALLKKLRGWLLKVVQRALHLVETPALIRRVDLNLADDIDTAQRSPMMPEDGRRALERVRAIARGDVQ